MATPDHRPGDSGGPRQESERPQAARGPDDLRHDYAAAELEFMLAMQEYKRISGRMFPTWSEILEVLTGLGYEKAGDHASRGELMESA